MIDSLFLRKNLDLYLTGSNAYMLSGELATHLSGRYVTIAMLPLLFGICGAFTGSRDGLSATYRRYLETSFPYATELGGDRKAIEEYRSGIYHTSRAEGRRGETEKNADPMMLESVLRFVYSSTGSPISTKKISDTMGSRRAEARRAHGRKISVGVCGQLHRLSGRGAMTSAASSISRRLKSIMPWISACGIICLAGAMRIPATSSKNVIYLELLRREYDVYIRQARRVGSRFCCRQSDGERSMCRLPRPCGMNDTLARELRPLQKIRDSYPKLILTLDDDPPADYEGIRRINALEWLMDSP